MTGPLVDRFKTLSQAEPEFRSYLDGSFSKTHVALPVRSLNIGSAAEQITFEVVANDALKLPGWGHVAWTLIRPASLVFSVGPMIAVLFFCASAGFRVDRLIGVTSFLGVVLFQIAMNLFNDYGDHIKGQDRLRPQGGSRAIQKGWIRAFWVKRLAWIFLGGAVLLGLPAAFYSLFRVSVIAGMALLVALEFAFGILRLKYRGWAEGLAFLLMGPLLVMGYLWAVADQAAWAEVSLGGIFGSIALMYFHSANFENIMADKNAGALTWATRAGFDASKKFFYFCAALVLGFTLAYVVLVTQEFLFVLVLLVQIAFVVPLCLRVRALASPLSSRLAGLRGGAIQLCALTTFSMVAVYIYILAAR